MTRNTRIVWVIAKLTQAAVFSGVPDWMRAVLFLASGLAIALSLENLKAVVAPLMV
jgi:hypothetical protein